ncbi:hypothetical protein J3Q64DRAFT_1739431 [Phycomyces blakesleeanus]|uniref:DUF962 domain-containing protein n=2 Tax=Phycomyces blakesleeanus TaxID=4837 RepID=A0A167NAG6_PHYB8|nr:hypothetical protein PHYBLDRAFT_110639 [Phycomyces blakesleeanus NRRL 1555(-)]OAD75490.1 hypothetical protein PHYBLDRAFT_110639 [Phycomyces blakesleeanus NRRL 1555(-)]|eukprot:XP_018293530.1 hypothetical protein PHYBLDRAFT_110639 [Phycomyces blakesleeanus NRRL 1555(-)]
MSTPDIFSLKKQLVLYGAHHFNKVNIAIHMVFVPVIFWTSLVFASKTGPLISAESLPSFLQWLSVWELNLSFFVVVFYDAYYAILDPIAALLYAPILFTMTYTATQFQLTRPAAIQEALVLHIVSWIFQFIGHGVAEKRSPRLVDNLVQALVSAPYFVFFEILFYLGYRPDLYREMSIDVAKDVKAFRARREAQRKAKSL